MVCHCVFVAGAVGIACVVTGCPCAACVLVAHALWRHRLLCGPTQFGDRVSYTKRITSTYLTLGACLVLLLVFSRVSMWALLGRCNLHACDPENVPIAV